MQKLFLSGYALLLLSWPTSLCASSPDSVLYQFPATVVTASRYRQPLRFTSENVAIITQEELTQLPAHNLLEGLNFTPGLSVRKNGGVGTRSSCSIQGSEPWQVTVLWDGIPLNDLAARLADPVQIPLEQVGRVEIVKGSASSVWGSALGGVIQVFSPPLDLESGYQLQATGSYGKWGTHQESAGIQGGTGSGGYLLTVSHSSTEGFRPRSSHDGVQWLGKAETEWRAGRWGASYGYLDGETEDFVQVGQAVWKQHAYTTQFGQIYYEGALHGEMEGRLQLFGVERKEEVSFLQVADDQVVQRGIRKEPVWGNSLQVIGATTPYGRLSGGADLRWSRADFRYVGGPEEKRFDEQGIYGNWHQVRGALALNVGLRHDRHSRYGSQWSPSVGGVYQYKPLRTLIRAHMARGFGAPPLAAAFLPETESTAPNPDLRAERVTGYHLGIESRFLSPLWLRITGFHNQVEDAIDSALNEKGKTIQKNFARQQRQGVELEGQLALLWGLRVAGGMVFNEVKSKDEEEILNGTARQTRDLILQYRDEERGMHCGLAGHYAEYDIAPLLREPPLNFTSRDGRFLWDLQIGQRLPGWGDTRLSVWAAAYNLLDTEFWWLTPYPLPGRALEVGCRWEYGG